MFLNIGNKLVIANEGVGRGMGEIGKGNREYTNLDEHLKSVEVLNHYILHLRMV